MIINAIHQIEVLQYGLENNTKNFSKINPKVNYRHVSFLEQLNSGINVSEQAEDLSTTRRSRLRAELQHLMNTLVRKITYQRRLKAAKRIEENRISSGEFPEGNEVETTAKAKRDMDMIREYLNLRKYFKKSKEKSMKREINRRNGSGIGEVCRVKRDNDEDAWIKTEVYDKAKDLKMHAFVVRQEEISSCCSPAKKVTYVKKH